MRRLREELGIVSSVSAWTWDLSAGGMLVLSASLDPTREPAVRTEIEAAISRLGRESVDDALSACQDIASQAIG